jgi:hypothetical protein
MLKALKVAAGVACVLALMVGAMWGQGIFATLTGVVSDPSNALVSGAKVTLTDAASGSARDTVTNNDGYFTFAAVPVGKYNLKIEAQGFEAYKADGIDLGGAEKRNVNVTLTVGSTSQTVEVSAEAAQLVTTDSGEKSYTLEAKQLQNLVQIGSDAAEYIKIMPGFAVQNGSSNAANYTGEVIGINANGDGGSQSPLNNASSYNGLPGNSLDITMDGAHVADPGCDCDTPVNPNSDFLQEFRVLAGNFSAENQKGPILITSVTRSGGQHLHGSGYFTARNYKLNANDWLNNNSGAPKPANKFYYPGGTIGGTVPKTHDKLFYFAGFEYFYQVLDTGLLRSTVPTANMLNGNFSTSELEKIGDATNGYDTGGGGTPVGTACSGTGPYIPCLNAAALTAFQNNGWASPTGSGPTWDGSWNVNIPTSAMNQNMLNLMKLYPAPNADPNTTGGYNYVQSEIFNQNNTQFVTREDYAISNSTKLFVRYNYQKETQQFPVGLWWRQSDQVPYPSAIEGKNRSSSISGSLTHVFSPTMTNEAVVAYTLVKFPNVFANPNAVTRATVGYNVQGLFKNGITQIPSFGGTGGNGEAALVFNPGGFEAGGASQGLYANKYMPSVSDTITKVIGTHTIKGGFFWEWIRNVQPANNNTNGYLQFVSGSNPLYTSGDSYADEALGIASNYNEATKNRLNDEAYNTVDFFAQDDWKATRRLTINFGLRLSHLQPWYDRLNDGFAIFSQSAYSTAYAADPTCTNAPTFCGYEWHAQNPSVPITGYPSRALYYQPRLGGAYDLRGDGKTVLRGGWGRYYFHTGQFTSGLDASAGVKSTGFSNQIALTSTTSQPILVNPLPAALASQAPWSSAAGNAGLDTVDFSANPSGPAAVDGTDDKMGFNDDWNFTISRQLPWSSLFEVAYIGNRSRDLSSGGNGGSLGSGGGGFTTNDINLIPVGSITAYAAAHGNIDPNTVNTAILYPLQGYSDLNVTTNNGRANYNALQATWARTRGRYTLDLNYTFSKAEGVVSDGSGRAVDIFDINKSIGVLPNSRKHLFNAVYSVEMPAVRDLNRYVGGVVNGWQVSGILQLQSGPNLSAFQNENFGMSYVGDPAINNGIAVVPGTNFAINDKSLLGTTEIQLNPIVTCNPTSGLKAHQYINGNCFAAPSQVGQNGPFVLPSIYGPAYFKWDMALFKNFAITESQKLQFRFNFYNFLNHPLWSFNGNNLGLNFQQDATGAFTQSNSTFGYTTQKQGHRIIEMGAKYIF